MKLGSQAFNITNIVYIFYICQFNGKRKLKYLISIRHFYYIVLYHFLN